jgi:3-oxoacyl-[acyl-carrier-protein] synthase-3
MPLDRDVSRRMFLSVCEIAERLLGQCYARAGVDSKDVDFFAAHQATVWWRRVVQEHLGLEHARSFDTYLRAGTLSGANLPFVLHEARNRGLLNTGDLVAMFQAGTGATYSASLLRWGGTAVG